MSTRKNIGRIYLKNKKLNTTLDDFTIEKEKQEFSLDDLGQ
jgi:hypothetical protein